MTTASTVLMIEDNPVDVQLVTEELSLFEGGGDFRLENARSLEDGLARMDQQDVGSVLLDLSLPDSSGLETFVRAHEHDPDMPIVVLTGNDNEELGLKAVQRGAQDYLVKGKVDGSTLVRTLRYALERKRLEGELRQAQKMEVIGQLAGGIAHDFNNLLMVVLGKLQALEWPLRNDESLLKEVRAASRAVLDGANLTERLLSVARQQPTEPKVINLSAQIEGMKSLMLQTMRQAVEIRTDLSADAWSTKVDPSRLEAVVLNLLVNARDAMPGGGCVTIRTGNELVEEGELGTQCPAGEYVVLEVSDIGVGMSAEVRRHAAEPLYTTKDNGDGLGLAMAHGFLREVGGYLGVESEEGYGTSIKLFLPRAYEPVEQVATDTGTHSVLQLGEEKVLVVEDNNAVRETVVGHLGALGYQVVEAHDAPSALDAIRQHEDIDLVFLDVLLPGGIDGITVAREALSLRPNVRVLYTSAYTQSAFSQVGVSDEVVDLLHKPYRRKDLARKVRQLLDD